MNSTKQRRQIEKMNFDRIKKKLCSRQTDITHSSKPWSPKKASLAIQQYKRYLWVLKKYQTSHRFLPPSAEIDLIWHSHILDTKAYVRDCQQIFGQILHHDPYFGLNGKKDRSKLFKAFETTQKLYFAEFGEYIYSLEDL